MVRTNVLVANARENSHLVQRILFLFVRQLAHLHLLERVGLGVCEPAHIVNGRVSTLACMNLIIRGVSLGHIPSRLTISKSFKDI